MRVGLAIVAVVVLAVALYFATLESAGVTCEICVDFEGRSACRSASAADRETAVRSARDAACAVLAQGVTAGMQCNRAPLRSESCTP